MSASRWVKIRNMEAISQPQRLLIKLSGEALKGDQPFGISDTVINDIADEIKEASDLGFQIAIVTGGGNFFRGNRPSGLNIDRASADYMGMLATLINGIALQDAFEKAGLTTRMISALQITEIAEPFIRRRAVRHLEKGRVIIFAAGTGSPFFSTDTAAALRAIEIRADILLKGTLVDGVFSDDPLKVKDAVKYDSITYSEVLSKELKVIDSTAVTLCKENNLKVKIFKLTQKGNILKAITNSKIGTIIN